jgi:uncharacterized protein (TIGR03118 family)
MTDASIHSTLSTSPTSRTQSKSRHRILIALSLPAISISAAAQTAGTYTVSNLVSDGSVPATITDTNFINPWGITNSTFWINTQGTGLDYVISPTNFPPFTPPATPAIAFKISIPAATGGATATGSPTGAASIGTATGFVLPNGTKASFLFASLDGIITGWNSKLGTAGAVAQVAINNSTAGAVYTDVALVANTNGTYLLAANFGKAAAIEVYDSTFAPAKLAGSFTDTTLPAGYVPYSIHVIGTQVFITYALRATTGGPTVAPGDGMVNVFDTNGNFVAHAITPGGNLNAPWGLAIAPANFGIFSGDLLVGNFGDGIINVYDPKTFAFLGQLSDGTGKTLAYASLWELFFGLTAPTATTTTSNLNTLYFTAGLAGEKHGLLGSINTNPTATGTATFGFSASAPTATVAAGSSATFVISVAPTNNFSGTVSLACSGQPEAATCTFSPAQLTVTSGSPATSTVTIATVQKMACVRPFTIHGTSATKVTVALFLPLGALLLFPRRRSLNQQRHLRLLGLLGILLVSAGFFAGCSSMSDVFVPSTPAGTSAITIKATSGTITQSTIVNLTVQ